MSMSRVLAGLLNFFVWGAGYLYLGERSGLGWFLIAGYLLIHWFWVAEYGVIAALTNPVSLGAFGGHLLISLGLGYDVYSSQSLGSDQFR